ncbi:MAG: IS982 family transposase [Moraxellaceae bacterium]|nr:IS982 family transposase [Moraxellaceae bacterium]
MENLLELYCHIDDYCQLHETQIKQHLLEFKQTNSRNRPCSISLSEIMTILVLFHQLRFRYFKVYYNQYVKLFLKREFPNLPSYNRFIELVPRVILPMCGYLQSLFGECTGVSYIDSTPLKVCDNKRISRHKVFKGLAERGKSSMGWFFGFKLHAVINDKGEIINLTVTKGNVDDRKPVKQLCKDLYGKLFADKGYIDKKLTDWLAKNSNVELFTKIRKNMKPKPMQAIDKRLLKRRTLVETVFDELKNLCQIEHSRHRSINGFISNLLGGLIAYCWQPNKPTLRDVYIEKNEKIYSMKVY